MRKGWNGERDGESRTEKKSGVSQYSTGGKWKTAMNSVPPGSSQPYMGAQTTLLNYFQMGNATEA